MKQSMTKKTVRRVVCSALCLLLLLVASLTFSGCEAIQKENEEHKQLCTRFMDALIADDYDTAYELIKATVSEDDFETLFEQMTDYINGVKNYELKQIGWNYSTKNGVTMHQSTFEMTADNGKVYTIQVITTETIEGIAGIHLLDNTELEERADAFQPINIILKIVSLAFLVLTVLLIIDCCRSKIRRKALWIIIMLLGVAFSISLGSGIHLNWNIGLILQMMGVSANAASRSIIIRLYLPVGAIVYFCMRNRLKRDAAAREAQTPIELPVVPAEDSNPDGTRIGGDDQTKSE